MVMSERQPIVVAAQQWPPDPQERTVEHPPAPEGIYRKWNCGRWQIKTPLGWADIDYGDCVVHYVQADAYWPWKERAFAALIGERFEIAPEWVN